MHSEIQSGSPVPVPGTVPKRSVHPAEGGALDQPGGLALWGGSGRGTPRLAEPVAERRFEEHRASRRGPYLPNEIEPSQGFRLLCALIRQELRAHPALNWREGYADLVEHMKTAAAKAQLPYGQDRLTRALNAIESSVKARAPKRFEPAPQAHWRERCTHTPTCGTPNACALRAAKEGQA